MKEVRSDAMGFYSFDGDNIESVIEAYLIRGNIDAVGQFSAQITSTLEEIVQKIFDGGGIVIYCAGDNILFRGQFSNHWCEEILGLFLSRTRRTASMGIGDTAIECYLALKIAKSQGGGQVFRYH